MKKERTKEMLRKDIKVAENGLKYKKNPFLIASVILLVLITTLCFNITFEPNKKVDVNGHGMMMKETDAQNLGKVLSGYKAVVVCDLKIQNRSEACTILANPNSIK